MESIEKHIQKDKDIIDDPLANPAARRRLQQATIMTLMHLSSGVTNTQKNLNVWYMTTNGTS